MDDLQDGVSSSVNATGTSGTIDTPLTQVRSADVHGFTYFIRVDDAIKIGFATNFNRRLSGLQTAHEKPIVVLAVVPASMADEFKTHQLFAHLRIRGEWFRPEQDLLDFIDALKAKPHEEYQPPAAPKKPLRARHSVDPVIAKLSALRSRQQRDGRAHGIISNLIEALDNLAKTTDPTARGHLEKYAASTTKLIGQLLTAA